MDSERTPGIGLEIDREGHFRAESAPDRCWDATFVCISGPKGALCRGGRVSAEVARECSFRTPCENIVHDGVSADGDKWKPTLSVMDGERTPEFGLEIDREGDFGAESAPDRCRDATFVCISGPKGALCRGGRESAEVACECSFRTACENMVYEGVSADGGKWKFMPSVVEGERIPGIGPEIDREGDFGAESAPDRCWDATFVWISDPEGTLCRGGRESAEVACECSFRTPCENIVYDGVLADGDKWKPTLSVMDGEGTPGIGPEIDREGHFRGGSAPDRCRDATFVWIPGPSVWI